MGDAEPAALFSGLLATRSGLVFTGDQLGHAWRSTPGLARPCGSSRPAWINASPITYELEGTQYVAILSGLGGDPSFYFKGPKGGMLWVFAPSRTRLSQRAA